MALGGAVVVPPYLLTTIWMVLCLALVIAAFWRGRWPERTAALGLLINSVASYFSTNTYDWFHVQVLVWLEDFAYGLLLFFVAAKTRRVVYLVAAGLQTAIVLNHLVFALTRIFISPPAYLAMETVLSFMVLGTLAAGVGGGRRDQ